MGKPALFLMDSTNPGFRLTDLTLRGEFKDFNVTHFDPLNADRRISEDLHRKMQQVRGIYPLLIVDVDVENALNARRIKDQIGAHLARCLIHGEITVLYQQEGQDYNDIQLVRSGADFYVPKLPSGHDLPTVLRALLEGRRLEDSVLDFIIEPNPAIWEKGHGVYRRI